MLKNNRMNTLACRGWVTIEGSGALRVEPPSRSTQGRAVCCQLRALGGSAVCRLVLWEADPRTDIKEHVEILQTENLRGVIWITSWGVLSGRMQDRGQGEKLGCPGGVPCLQLTPQDPRQNCPRSLQEAGPLRPCTDPSPRDTLVPQEWECDPRTDSSGANPSVLGAQPSKHRHAHHAFLKTELRRPCLGGPCTGRVLSLSFRAWLCWWCPAALA